MTVTELFYKTFFVVEEETKENDYFSIQPKPHKIAEFIEKIASRNYHKGFNDGLVKLSGKPKIGTPQKL